MNFGLTLSPTSQQWQGNLGVDDYRNKEKRQSQMTLPFHLLLALLGNLR
jgi:hypothetical protein